MMTISTRRSRATFLAALLAVFLAPRARADGSEAAAALLAGAHLFGSSACAVIKMDMIIAEGGEVKKRGVELSFDHRNGRVLTMARIVSPAFLSDMKFLKRSEPGQPDAQWIKTSRGVRRLGVSSRSEPVFGSHFTAEDFGNVDAANFSLDLAPERDTPTARAVSAVPRVGAPYACRIVFVDRASGLVTGMEYLDGSGAAIRRYRVTAIEGSGAETRPVETVMEAIATGGSTTLRILSFQASSSLPERTFNPGAL
jgi:hypothetical protein